MQERRGSSETPLNAFLDTNVVVRYLTGSPPHLAARAVELIDGAERLFLTDGIIAEIAFVLTRLYEASREFVVDALADLLRRKNIHVHGIDNELAIDALMLCRPSGRVSFADAMLWAVARSTGVNSRIYTFDERFPAAGIDIRREI